MSGFPQLGYPAGVKGATAASRYVGATLTGAPVAGTFRAGDFIVAQDGVLWFCTAAGTPGTWAQAAGIAGAFLSIASNLSDVANVTTARNNLNAQEAGTSVLNADTAHNNSISTAGGGLGNGWVYIGVSGNADHGFWVQNQTAGTTATTYVQAANDDRTAGIGIVATSSIMNTSGLIHPSLSMLEVDISDLLIFTSAAKDITFATGGVALANERLRIIAASGKVRVGGTTGALLSSGASGRLDLDGTLALGGTCVLTATGTRLDLPGNLLVGGASLYLLGGASRFGGGSEIGGSDSGMAVYLGTGAPNNALGNNNEFYYRADGTHAGLTCIYHREAGVWVGIA